MLVRISCIFKLFISLFKSDHSLYRENILLKKEDKILKRKLNLKRINVSRSDNLFLIFLNLIGDIRSNISIVSPNTLLLWQRILLKNFMTFFKPRSHPGRPPVPVEVKNLILDMKNENLNWGTRRIRDELLKLNIVLHRKTIQNILHDFRRRGIKSIPGKEPPNIKKSDLSTGNIKKKSVLGNLHHHYFRSVA